MGEKSHGKWIELEEVKDLDFSGWNRGWRKASESRQSWRGSRLRKNEDIIVVWPSNIISNIIL